MENAQKGNMQKPLDERITHPDPINQFREWYDQAISAKLPFADAMALATATRDGKSSVRMVLLKEVDERGFVFYTNYVSRKGKELGVNPRACLLFYWSELNRQVRIEGTVHKISAAESDRYFQTRPRDSQISAVASPQSEVIKSREELERLAEDMRARGRRVEYQNTGTLFPDAREERMPYFIDPVHLSDAGNDVLGRFYAERILAARAADR